MTEKILIDALALAQLSSEEDVFIIDTRDPQAYQKGHIPGAVNVHDFFIYISLPENGGHPAMVEHFKLLLRGAGLTMEHKVVVYEDAMDNGYGQSCRAWYLLKYLGQPWAAVLHGGYRAWKAKQLPISQDIPNLEPSKYKPQLVSDIIVTTEQMQAAIGDPNIQILDNRDYAEWIGANSSPYGYDYCPRKGRIPGALWVEWYRLMTIKDGIPWFKSAEEIRTILMDAGFDPQKTTYIYCFKGARSSNSYTALKLAGFSDVRNYFNSWNEWSRDFNLPIEDGYPDQ
ncbi:MAG: sulfurtransferase [Anaerolineaceae bacterium]|nr:sulfurtransferase [Anaerolineaceae bacterium]